MKFKILFLLLMMFNFYNVEAETLEDKTDALAELVEGSLVSDILTVDDLYPVGSIYMSTSLTSPGTLFGGTWEAYATDKKLVGVGSNGTTTYSAGGTGGAATKTITTSNIPSHNHSLTATGSVTSTFNGSQVTTSSSGAHTHNMPIKQTGGEASGYGLSTYSGYKNRVYVWYGVQNKQTTTSTTYNSTHTVTPAGTVSSTFTGTSATSSSVGSGSSFSVQNPYVVVYMWKRTA